MTNMEPLYDGNVYLREYNKKPASLLEALITRGCSTLHVSMARVIWTKTVLQENPQEYFPDKYIDMYNKDSSRSIHHMYAVNFENCFISAVYKTLLEIAPTVLNQVTLPVFYTINANVVLAPHFADYSRSRNDRLAGIRAIWFDNTVNIQLCHFESTEKDMLKN